MKGVESKLYKNKVSQSKTNLIYHINFRVDFETWSKLIEIQEESDVSLSYLIRKAIAPLLEIGSDYIHFIPPLCPKCGSPLSSLFASKKLHCLKCGSTFEIKEVEEK